ncbi:hypothetical protein DY000_02046513 [Brassica cretica]|uniref:DUF3741 domain-containing protein n=1 Tax=Brassica cretica TaxID=69181 RepID=A0ABQ7F3W2_BRACR|nr:hypothetical protein DY000_02046513 [Brassica cretica]
MPCVTSHAFVFFKVPRKLSQSVKKFVKRRCGKTLQPRTDEDAVKEENWCGKGVVFGEGSSRCNCIQDIERMLQGMSKEFGFGSFWRHEDSSDILYSSGKGVVIRSSQTGEIQRGGRNKSSENREDKRKGKRVASSPQMVWKQKDGRGATKTSRSTGESTANQISSGEKNEQRSIMEKSKGSRDLAELKEAGSAFKRLGSSEKSGSGGSRG